MGPPGRPTASNFRHLAESETIPTPKVCQGLSTDSVSLFRREKENPAKPGRACGVEFDLGNVNASDNATDPLAGLAVRRLARRLNCPIYMAALYADLAGLGIAA